MTNPAEAADARPVILPDLLPLTGAALPAVDAVLKHQAVASAVIFCSDQDLMLGGLPVDRADHILLCGVDLPSPWEAVVRRHATQVERPADWRGILGSAGAEKKPESVSDMSDPAPVSM